MTHSSLSKAYSDVEFRKIGHQLVDHLADHLKLCSQEDGRPLHYVTPDEEYAFWNNYELNDPMTYFSDITSRSIATHHRRYIGHQVAPPLPLTALSGLVSEFLNCGMGIYEMGAASTAIEKIVIEQFTEKVGYNVNLSDGFLTSGGTLANLTGLLAARSRFQHKSQKEPVILVSEEAHFCIDRAAMTMGLRSDQVVKIKVDEQFRMLITDLEKAIQSTQLNDQAIMAIVGSSCTTSTGSYDDLEGIASLCSQHDIWMHVDGAHGGAAVFSDSYKDLCRGIEKADSIIIDAHKMLMVPALATAVLFKKGEDSYKALAIDAAYLFDKGSEEWFNLAKRTYETTKYMMSIKIFMALKYYGLELINEYITRQYDLTRSFYEMIASHPKFEAPHYPMSNILCFRYRGLNSSDLNQINKEIRNLLLSDGKFYIVQTQLNQQIYLRVTIMSPMTEAKDLQDLLRKIEDIANGIERSE